MRDAKLDNDVLKFQKAQAELRAMEERKRIGEKRDQYIADQKQHLKDAELIKAQQLKDKSWLQDMERAKNQEQVGILRREQLENAKQKHDAAKGYKHDLINQMAEKKYMSDRERDQDKLYAALEDAQAQKTEQSRKAFFDHLRGFQDKNDAKLQALRNFMGGKDLASLSAADEERMWNQLQEKNLRDQKLDEQKNIKARNAKMDNLSFLKRQMLEKQQRA